MSLINDLLCDLQERKSAAPGVYRLSDLQPVPRTQVANTRRLLVPAAALLLTGGALSIWLVSAQPTSAAASQTPAANATEQVAATQAATLTSRPVAAPTEPTTITPLPVIDTAPDNATNTPQAADTTAGARAIDSGRAAVAITHYSAAPARLIMSAVLSNVEVTHVARRDGAAAQLAGLAQVDAPPAAAPAQVAIHDVRPDSEADSRAPTHTVPDAEEPVDAAPVRTATNRAADPKTLGVAALASGAAAQAEDHFREFLGHNPADGQAWLYLHQALAQQGRDNEAEGVLAAALERVTKPAPVARTLARRMLNRNATREALQLLQAYRPASPLHPEHDAFIAALQQRLGHHEIAAQHYRAILAVRPQNAAWWVGLAISEEARGKRSDALDAYRHARNIGNLNAQLAVYTDQRIAAIQATEQS